jgi:hypothetical protein
VRELEARRQTASRDRTVPNIARAENLFSLPPDCMFPTDTPGACSSQTLLSIGELTGLLQLCIAVLHETKPDDEE